MPFPKALSWGPAPISVRGPRTGRRPADDGQPVNELAEAAGDKQLSRTIARNGRVDLLCLDELGYMELDRRAIVDRLTFADQIIETAAASYRLTHARQQQKARNPAGSLVR